MALDPVDPTDPIDPGHPKCHRALVGDDRVHPARIQLAYIDSISTSALRRHAAAKAAAPKSPSTAGHAPVEFLHRSLDGPVRETRLQCRFFRPLEYEVDQRAECGVDRRLVAHPEPALEGVSPGALPVGVRLRGREPEILRDQSRIGPADDGRRRTRWRVASRDAAPKPAPKRPRGGTTEAVMGRAADVGTRPRARRR